MRTEYKSRVKDLLVKISPSHLDTASINDDSLLFDELGFDSVGFIALITELEKEFQITIKPEYLLPEYFESINRINEYLGKAIGNIDD